MPLDVRCFARYAPDYGTSRVRLESRRTPIPRKQGQEGNRRPVLCRSFPVFRIFPAEKHVVKHMDRLAKVPGCRGRGLRIRCLGHPFTGPAAPILGFRQGRAGAGPSSGRFRVCFPRIGRGRERCREGAFPQTGTFRTGSGPAFGPKVSVYGNPSKVPAPGLPADTFSPIMGPTGAVAARVARSRNRGTRRGATPQARAGWTTFHATG